MLGLALRRLSLSATTARVGKSCSLRLIDASSAVVVQKGCKSSSAPAGKEGNATESPKDVAPAPVANNPSNAVAGADDLPPLPQDPHHYSPPFPVRPRTGSAAPEYYMSRSSVGHPDPLAVALNAGRSDREYQWLKLLCFVCVISTFGPVVYGIFFEENMKWFKDEPWSPFRN